MVILFTISAAILSTVFSVLSPASLRAMGRGDRDAAEQAWLELVQLSAKVGDRTGSVMATASMATLAFIDSRLEDAAELWQSVQAFSDANGVGSHFRLRGGGARRPEFYFGRLSEADLVNLGPQNQRTFVVARAGVSQPVRGGVRNPRPVWDVSADEDESALFALRGLLEVSIRCGDTTTAEALVRRLSSLAGRLQPHYTIVGFGRLLGEVAAILRRPEQARDYLRQALEVCQRVRFRPEIALLHLDLAQLSSGSSRKRAEAVEHLRFKAEVIHRQTWRSLEQVELATAEWVEWWNQRRMHTGISDLPRAEYEAHYLHQHVACQAA